MLLFTIFFLSVLILHIFKNILQDSVALTEQVKLSEEVREKSQEQCSQNIEHSLGNENSKNIVNEDKKVFN
jgi:S-ribosylhomocysteine lyase LuxS involved in autoinducer biosynthesis